jgi:hypothetical protein
MATEGPAASAPPGAVAARPAPLEWAFQPWRERPTHAALAAAAALGLCALVLALGLPPLTALLLCVVNVGALAPVFVPARCRIDADGVGLRGPAGWTRRAWRDVRRARTGPAGLRVSPFTRRHWLDPWRGLFLPFPSAQAAGLERAVRARLADHDLPT